MKTKTGKLKLYVWTGFSPDYSDGLAFAIAASEEDAKKLIEDQDGEVYTWGDLHVHDLNEPVAYSEAGGG